MEQMKIDPRALRTRKLIIDSFLTLSNKKTFSEISVKDITSEAMINRATFYNHFVDKYDLLEQVTHEKLALDLNCGSMTKSITLENSLKLFFISLTNFKESLNHICKTHEEVDVVNLIVQKKVSKILSSLLREKEVSRDIGDIQQLSNFLTYGIIGLSDDWLEKKHEINLDQYIDSLLPFILSGISPE